MCLTRSLCHSRATCCLLLMSVYMPYEGEEFRTDDYAEQLAIIDSLIEANTDCHAIIAGDFNVDLSRQRIHTAMLQSFYRATAMLSAVYAVVVCLCVCLSHSGIVSKRLNVESRK